MGIADLVNCKHCAGISRRADLLLAIYFRWEFVFHEPFIDCGFTYQWSPSRKLPAFRSSGMTLEGKLIQKEGAKKVIMGIIVFLIIFLVNGDEPIPMWKDGHLKEILKVKNELTFLFGDALLHILMSNCFIENCQFSLDYFFTSKSTYILNINLKECTISLLHIFILDSWSLMVFKLIINKPRNLLNIATVLMSS